MTSITKSLVLIVYNQHSLNVTEPNFVHPIQYTEAKANQLDNRPKKIVTCANKETNTGLIATDNLYD